MKKQLIILLIVPLLVGACTKESLSGAREDYLSAAFELKAEDGDKGKEACFEIQFPITVILPDGDELTGESREELNKAIKAWYKENAKEKKARIKIKYPIKINFQGKEIKLENERMMERVRMECKKGDDGKGDKDKTPCFTMVFPLSFEMPDGAILSGDSREELSKKMKAWHKENPDVKEKGQMVYPVTVIFKEKELVIENDEQMERLKKACAGADKEKSCIEILFPVTMNMPDGSSLSIDNAKEKSDKLKEWYKKNPGYDKESPELAYPVEIKFKGRQVTVSSEREMNRYKEACKGV